MCKHLAASEQLENLLYIVLKILRDENKAINKQKAQMATGLAVLAIAIQQSIMKQLGALIHPK